MAQNQVERQDQENRASAICVALSSRLTHEPSVHFGSSGSAIAGPVRSRVVCRGGLYAFAISRPGGGSQGCRRSTRLQAAPAMSMPVECGGLEISEALKQRELKRENIALENVMAQLSLNDASCLARSRLPGAIAEAVPNLRLRGFVSRSESEALPGSADPLSSWPLISMSAASAHAAPFGPAQALGSDGATYGSAEATGSSLGHSGLAPVRTDPRRSQSPCC